MVKLNKGREPQILINNSVKWSAELMSYVISKIKVPSHISSNYNQSEIKDALRIETHNKCMYCESPIAHVSYEHIEHIMPKASNKYPQFCFTWSNLGLACPKCNMNKSDEYDVTYPFINPYVDEPDDFFYFVGTYIFHKKSDMRADTTITVIELNRPELLERRHERIQLIKSLIDKYNSLTDSPIKSSLLKQINIELENDKPYSMCTRSLAKYCLNI